MFFIIWRGWGILTPILALVIWFLPLALIEGVLGHATYSHYDRPLSFFFALLAAGAIWVVGKTLNGVPGRTLIDPRTGGQVILRKHHDLFYIPMQWWAIPTVLLGVLSLFASS